MAALMRGEIPRREENDGIPEQMLRMMKQCWNHTPSARPTCDEIQSNYFSVAGDRVMENSQMLVDRKAFWKATKANSSIDVDYERIRRILRQVCNLSTGIMTSVS